MFERGKERLALARPALIPLFLYIGSLAVAMSWLENLADSPLRFVVMAVPALLGLWVVLAVAKALSKLDELERKVLLSGMGFSFAITLVFTETWGILEVAGGLPPLNGIYIALMMVVLMLVGKLWNKQKYE